jgi:hypothetical protein
LTSDSIREKIPRYVEASSLESAVRRVLRPLVRILLRNGVPIRAFIEQAKQVYVEIALSEFGVPNRKPSLSRASVLTGLTRKEVSRLAAGGAESTDDDRRSYNRAAQVIRGWVRDPGFHDGQGEPRALPVEGAPDSFSNLVRKYSGDMPARAVLDELLRVGAVREASDGRIELVERAYVPVTGERERLAILGTDVGALISTIDHNLTSPPEEAFFQLKVSYDNLPAEVLAQLRRDAGKQALALLETLDGEWSKHDRDLNPDVPGTGKKFAMLGIYYYEEDADSEDTPSPAASETQ